MTDIKCKSILYSPVNDYTTKIIKKVAYDANLTDNDIMGLESIDLIKRDNLTTFFHVDFRSAAFNQ